jgi:aldose 1-epimerase
MKPVIELHAGNARAVIDLVRGGRLASLTVDGLDLLLPRSDDPMRWGCYPMAPWAGRVRLGRFRFAGQEHSLPLDMPPHAIHGTTYTRAWTDEGGGRLSISLGDAWPWPGRAVQQLTLFEDALEMILEVHADEEPFPASLGWHPWFPRRLTRGGAAEIQLDAAAMYQRDDGHLPTGELVPPPPGPWDDCFTRLRRPPGVRWPGALEITLQSDLEHVVVYDEPEHAVCVEPLTGPPDALNLAPRMVTPGTPLCGRVRLEWAPA